MEAKIITIQLLMQPYTRSVFARQHNCNVKSRAAHVWSYLTCLQSADCFLVVTGTLGMKVAAPLHDLWTAAWGEVVPSENSVSQQSGGSCSLMAWKSSFQLWVGGVSMSVRYSLLKNCHITNRASVDPGACLQSHTHRHTPLKYSFKNQISVYEILVLPL